MKIATLGIAFASIVVIGAIACARSTHRASYGPPVQLHAQMGPGTMGGMGPMGRRGNGMGGVPRHRFAMMRGVPEPYASMTDPLPHTSATLQRGAKVYAASCAICHGKTGLGDGAAGKGLTPPPANLAALSGMPMGQSDAFVVWSVSEGGAQFGSAMPAFKDSLSKDDIWAVTAYVRAGLPQGMK